MGLGRVAVRGLTGPSGAREERVTRGERGSGGTGRWLAGLACGLREREGRWWAGRGKELGHGGECAAGWAAGVWLGWDDLGC